MKLLLGASMIAVGMPAAAPLAPAHAATYRHPITHARVYGRGPAWGAPSRAVRPWKRIPALVEHTPIAAAAGTSPIVRR
jgi:hypothetical protein